MVDLQSREIKTVMAAEGVRNRITTDAAVCGGNPCIRDTRIPVSVVLDGLAEGLSTEQLIDHYPQLTREDIQAALAYAAELSRESVWKVS